MEMGLNRNRENPNGKRHSWVCDGAQLKLNIINDANLNNVLGKAFCVIVLQ